MKTDGLVKESASIAARDPDTGFTRGGSGRNEQPRIV
jgi:hypothetical protein